MHRNKHDKPYISDQVINNKGDQVTRLRGALLGVFVGAHYVFLRFCSDYSGRVFRIYE